MLRELIVDMVFLDPKVVSQAPYSNFVDKMFPGFSRTFVTIYTKQRCNLDLDEITTVSLHQISILQDLHAMDHDQH